MINYNLDQNQANPATNNYCGGYALAAILNSVNNQQMNQPPPLPIYNAIQINQNGNIGPQSQGFINDSLLNGTLMCLPSSIAICAQVNFALRPTICFNQIMLNNLGFAGVVTEEIARLNGNIPIFNIQGNLVATLNQLQGFNHFIIFVNGTHWIAVERNGIGFIVYDPSQMFQNENIVIGDNTVNNFFAYSGVVIALKKQE